MGGEPKQAIWMEQVETPQDPSGSQVCAGSSTHGASPWSSAVLHRVHHKILGSCQFRAGVQDLPWGPFTQPA